MPLPKVEMTVFEAILAIRSVRRYKARKVDRTIIKILLEAAVRAPMAAHHEPWAFVIIQDITLMHNLSDQAKPLLTAEEHEQFIERADHSINTFSHQNFNIFYNASTLILICGKTTAPLYVADFWLAAQNLMLSACAMGLGTCVIGSALSALNISDTKIKLNISEKFSVVAPIVVGYPDDEIIHTMRKNPLILANIQAINGY